MYCRVLTKIKKRNNIINPKKTKKIGNNIEIWIDVPNWVILEGWWSVFHQFTENLIIGILIRPIQTKIEPISGEKSKSLVAAK